MKSNVQTPNALTVGVIIVGYLIAIVGALSVFSVPMTVTLVTLIAGEGIVFLASHRDYPMPRFTRSTWFVWVTGTAVILGVLLLIGEDRVRHWTPHPAGYQLVWLIGLCMFQHLRHILHHDSVAPTAA